MRGSVKGGLWAVALAGGGLTFVSLAAPPVMRVDGPATPQLQMPQPIVAAPSAEELALNTGNDTAPSLTAPAPVAPVSIDEPALEVDTTPAAPPVAAEASDDMTAPADAADPETTDNGETPVATAEATPLPVPEVEEAAPATADASDDATSEVPVTEVAVEEAEDAGDETAATDDAAMAETAEVPTVDETPAPAELAEDETATEEVAELPEQPSETPLVSTTEPEAAAAPLIVQAPVTDEAAPQEATDETAAASVEEEVQPAPAPVIEEDPAPVTPASEIRINRPGAEESDPAGEEAVIVTPDAEAEDLPALEAFASLLENPDGLPLLAVILVDDGTNGDAPTAISALGFTPTVALNVLNADAADRMATYRAAGIEVALQTGLPTGARPADLEVAFEAAFDILPEAAMLFSDGGGVLQSDRAVAAQAMQVLAAQGRGFVAVQRGLGSVTREAEDAGVPSIAVTREIEVAGKDQRAIIRDLDQAAFRARQSGGAVLLGQATPETLAALRDWAAELDQDQLLIAPVSATLLAPE